MADIKTQEEFNHLLWQIEDQPSRVGTKLIIAYKMALARIAELEACIEKMTWKPYPETRPESNGHYLIRRKGQMIPQVRWFENRCREWFWENDDLIWWMSIPPSPDHA